MQYRELIAGDLVWYYKRLGTIVKRSLVGAPLAVEVEDDGGLVRQFPIVDPSVVQPLPNQNLGVLDVLHGVTRPNLTDREKLDRIAEKWLADPRVGDVFDRDNRVWVEIYEIHPDQSIGARLHTPIGMPPYSNYQSVVFKDANSLRRRFQFKTKPGYELRPYATERPDYAGHPLLSAPWSSPLFSWESLVQDHET